MAVTIKEIAEKTGVSRGTIDRVLHGRGSVNAGTAELVMKTAEEMGYKPNRVGRALAARKKQYRIGVIITSGNTQLEDGVKAVENLAGDYGASIDIYHLEEVSPEKQAELIEKLAERDHFVVLQPIDDALVRSALKRAYDKGICCITVGTDIDGIEKICHVGPDHEKSGAAAAGIVGLIRGNSASVGIITGKTVTTEDKKKAESFKKVLEERYRGASVEVSYKADNAADEAYSDTMHMLEGYSNINTLYVIGGGIEGICRAAKASGRKLTVIGGELNKSTEELLRKGELAAVVGQESFTQGKAAVENALYYLVNGEVPEKEWITVKTELFIPESV